ncbi:DUF6207 family protein [Streptomyces sp. NPDC007157]|uniref:DUF6207 family protein n=1 Tax=Streptomyces sp. NPDC007157 TaxID=3154681 RepID=UPI0033E15795
MVADAATALALQDALAARWATATAGCVTRDPGQPGVGLRCYLDLRQSPSSQTFSHEPWWFMRARFWDGLRCTGVRCLARLGSVLPSPASRLPGGLSGLQGGHFP